MPNHLTSVCTVTGDAAVLDTFAALVFRVENGATIFDFGTIVPQPEIVSKTESGSDADDGFFALTGLHKVEFMFSGASPMHLAAHHGRFPNTGPMTTREDYLAWLEKERPEAIEKGRLSLQCFRETGHRNWYDWNCENWGTKWGAYGYAERFREPQKLVFEFQTAWAFPQPVFEALAKLFPGLTFVGATIDEGGPEYEWRYAGPAQQFARAEDSADRYRLVYGRERAEDEDEDEDEDDNA